MTNIEERLFDLRVPEGAIAIFWFGQNSFALKNSGGAVALIDPYFPLERPPEKFIHAKPPVDELRLKADVTFLTHDHGDHTCVESISRLLAANPEMHVIGPPESIERVEAEVNTGANLWPIVAGNSRNVGSMKAYAVYSKTPDNSPACLHLGYVIETGGGGRVYVSGDPQNDFAEVTALLEPIRKLKPDIGLLTTHPTEGEFPFFDGSVRTALQVGLKVAIPSHYACFAKRTYDPFEWAEAFPKNSPQRVVIPYSGAAMLSVERGWIGGVA